MIIVFTLKFWKLLHTSPEKASATNQVLTIFWPTAISGIKTEH